LTWVFVLTLLEDFGTEWGMDEVILSSQEARELVLSILEAVESVDEGTEVRASWPAEMRDWCDLLLARIYEEGGPPT
jgi:hypothetical protein